MIDSVVAGISYIGPRQHRQRLRSVAHQAINATRAGGVTQFQISASSGSGVAGYIFFNGLSNSTYIRFLALQCLYKSTQLMTLPSSGSVSVGWYANGTDGTWGSSGLFTYPVFQMSTSVLKANGNKLYLSNGTSIVLRGADYSYFCDDPNGSWMLPSGTIEWSTFGSNWSN